jgi:ribosome-associated heat shock protein Hsp15
MTGEGEHGTLRLDKWLWAARFFKTRSQAGDAIEGGRIRVNGDRPKRARAVHVGDEIEIRLPPYTHTLRVRALSGRRGPAAEAALLYQETPASIELRERLRWQLKAAGGLAGEPGGERPTKRERRQLDRFRDGDRE